MIQLESQSVIAFCLRTRVLSAANRYHALCEWCSVNTVTRWHRVKWLTSSALHFQWQRKHIGAHSAAAHTLRQSLHHAVDLIHISNVLQLSSQLFSSSSSGLHSPATRIPFGSSKMSSNYSISIEVLSSSSSETVLSSESASTSRPAPPYSLRDISLRMFVGKEAGLNVPLGFCLGLNDDIVIADTDNHRILVFDLKSGDLQYHFGVYGASPGYLVQPRKVSF